MRLQSRLLFVGILVFVFPLLFVWITQGFFATAYDNINTAEKNRVGLIHDTLAALLGTASPTDSVISNLVSTYANENPDITKIRIVEHVGDDFIIEEALDPKLIGTIEISDDLYRNLPLSGSTNSYIFEASINGQRTWQVFRHIESDNHDYFIFSEHSFAQIDAIMNARKQQSYLGLSAIFVFLIALAYWVNKQIYWEKKHHILEQQLRDRDLFSNMIAHEFRSPLTAIKGYASFLEEAKGLDSDEHRFAGNIKKSSERLVALVNDFLEVARLQSGKLEVTKQETDVRNILKQVSDDLGGLAKEKGLTLIFTANPKPVLMDTDSDRLTQVVTNIVSNAIKYTDKGSVELACEQIPGEVIIRVKDTGMGISAEDQRKLFAPFTRVGGVDSGSTTGTGLGMWITKQLAALLNGDIGIESIKGVGTHVVITFRT